MVTEIKTPYKVRSIKIFLCCVVFAFPLLVFAYTSVIAHPEDQKAVLKLERPEIAQEFFGMLDGFPHTFEFEVKNTQPFRSIVSVPDSDVQKNDISIIIVKAERRGVSEVGRTRIKENTWESTYNRMLAEHFRVGGTLEGEFQPGWYKIEVSSPNNEGKYRLQWGTENVKRGYFAKVRMLLEVKAFLNHSRFGIFLSPLIYIPLLFSVMVVGFVYYKKRKKMVP